MNITTLLIVASLAVASAARADDETRRALPEPQPDQLIAKLEAKNIEEVEVEGARVPAPTFTPRVWPAIAAPFWALLHPTQAWRILAPMPPDQARAIGNQRFDTSGYLEPIGVPPG